MAGHRGLVGSAICRALRRAGYENLCVRSHAELDLTEQQAVRDFFAAEKPDYVILAAAKVGGIHANAAYPAQFIYENLQIQNNVIHSAWQNGVKKIPLSGLVLHLSQALPAAHQRRILAYRRSGTH